MLAPKPAQNDNVDFECQDMLARLLSTASLVSLRQLWQRRSGVHQRCARACARGHIICGWQGHLHASTPEQDSGVEIIPADLPALFKHMPNPGESLMRKVMVAVQEFERDMVVARLCHGLQTRLDDMKKRVESRCAGARVNQQGEAKVNGSLSVLERVQPPAAVMRALRSIRKKVMANSMSWRPATIGKCQTCLHGQSDGL